VRLFTSNLWNSATGSSLHCVWVREHDGKRERLVSIWIGMPASEPQIQMQTVESDTVATTCAVRDEARADDIARETRDFIRWLHS